MVDENYIVLKKPSEQDMLETERHCFEKWAYENGFCLDCNFFEKGNNYEDDDTRLAFEIWMASSQVTRF